MVQFLLWVQPYIDCHPNSFRHCYRLIITVTSTFAVLDISLFWPPAVCHWYNFPAAMSQTMVFLRPNLVQVLFFVIVWSLKQWADMFCDLESVPTFIISYIDQICILVLEYQNWDFIKYCCFSIRYKIEISDGLKYYHIRGYMCQ